MWVVKLADFVVICGLASAFVWGLLMLIEGTWSFHRLTGKRRSKRLHWGTRLRMWRTRKRALTAKNAWADLYDTKRDRQKDDAHRWLEEYRTLLGEPIPKSGTPPKDLFKKRPYPPQKKKPADWTGDWAEDVNLALTTSMPCNLIGERHTWRTEQIVKGKQWWVYQRCTRCGAQKYPRNI